MSKKIIYFTAGQVPTATEIAEIAVLNSLTTGGYTVSVRNAVDSNEYGYGIETCDLKAGSPPSAYDAIDAYGSIDADRPVQFSVIGPAATVAEAGTLQLQGVRVDGTDISALTIADASEAADGVTWASDDTNTATVSVAGLVTGVAAGECTITATLTFATAKTMTASFTVTVTA